jgi:hypothetical protein
MNFFQSDPSNFLGPRHNGTFDSGIKPRSGTNDFLAGTGATGSLSQTVALLAPNCCSIF